MASYTPNYNLKKPADADTYDIADANGNMDLIDTALHSQNEAITTLDSKIEIDVGSFGGTLENALSSACSSFYSTVGTNDVVRRVKTLWSTYGNMLFGQMLRRNNKVFFSLTVHENGMYVGEYTISTSTLVFRSITEQIDSLNSKMANMTYANYIEPTFENGIADVQITQNVFGAAKIYFPICQLSTNAVATLIIRGCDMRNSNTLLRICLNDNSINQALGVFVHYTR